MFIQLLSLVLFLAALSLILFCGFIFPIWMIIQCVRRTDESTLFRVGWILLIVLTCSFGACLYGFFASGERKIKFISISLLVLLALLAGGLYVQMGNFKNKAFKSIPAIEEAIKKSSGLSESSRKELLEAIPVLAAELKTVAASSDTTRRDLNLFLILRTYIEDQQLTEDEAADWLGYFQIRETLTSQAMRDIRAKVRKKGKSA